MMDSMNRVVFATASVSIALAGMFGSVGIASASPNEDESGWSCVDDGNRICGPGNEQGAPAGQYDQGGVLVVPWDQLATFNDSLGSDPADD